MGSLFTIYQDHISNRIQKIINPNAKTNKLKKKMSSGVIWPRLLDPQPAPGNKGKWFKVSGE